MIPKRVIMHCSDTKDSGTVSWDAIRRYHIEVNGWSDIGYHYGVELVGDQYLWMPGRPEVTIGAHCRGENHDSIGVCLVGKFDAEPPPDPQLASAAELVARICWSWYIDPATQIFCHRDFDRKKTCPGRMFDLDRFRSLVSERLPAR